MGIKRHLHIYDESASDEFLKKLDGFHDESCDGMYMWGHSKYGVELEEIPMTINHVKCDKKFCSALIGSFLHLPADLRVKYMCSERVTLDMLFYNIDNDLYIVQIVNNYPTMNSFTLEVFDVIDSYTTPELNLYWLI